MTRNQLTHSEPAALRAAEGPEPRGSWPLCLACNAALAHYKQGFTLSVQGITAKITQTLTRSNTESFFSKTINIHDIIVASAKWHDYL